MGPVFCVRSGWKWVSFLLSLAKYSVGISGEAGGSRVGERNRTRKMAFVKSNVRLLGFIARKIEATDVERFVLLISFDEGPFCQW